jgi:hypothetical protein
MISYHDTIWLKMAIKVLTVHNLATNALDSLLIIWNNGPTYQILLKWDYMNINGANEPIYKYYQSKALSEPYYQQPVLDSKTIIELIEGHGDEYIICKLIYNLRWYPNQLVDYILNKAPQYAIFVSIDYSDKALAMACDNVAFISDLSTIQSIYDIAPHTRKIIKAKFPNIDNWNNIPRGQIRNRLANEGLVEWLIGRCWWSKILDAEQALSGCMPNDELLAQLLILVAKYQYFSLLEYIRPLLGPEVLDRAKIHAFYYVIIHDTNNLTKLVMELYY